MMLPPEHLSTLTIANLKANHLLLAIDRDRALFWAVPFDNYVFALFLTGEYAGRAFEISPTSGGTGTAIGPVEVRVDPASMATDGGDWHLRARGDVLAVSVLVEKNGFPERLWAPVADMPSLPDSSLYYSSWSLGMATDSEWVELVSVTDGALKTHLLRADAD